MTDTTNIAPRPTYCRVLPPGEFSDVILALVCVSKFHDVSRDVDNKRTTLQTQTTNDDNASYKHIKFVVCACVCVCCVVIGVHT